MEKEFEDFVKLARKALAESPWANMQTVKSYSAQLASEADEVLEAVGRSDREELKAELGDLFWDTLMVMLIAEKQGWFKPEESISGVLDKMKRRKPFLVTGRKVTLEEEERVWSEAKAKEKEKKRQ
ncbi:nucleotide pyrophosphohydrolase [Candidatus Woesearchaeota archaeon]|nr:nucleotide pyrophosphohydrolase [Candidatus Woesearchaeota archaeon]